jgi:UDP-GlcNAc:undecaprenyl-phosphate GlcNAc-1-phosphate transferase
VLPAFLTSYLVALAATPLAIRVARRYGIVDHPVGYKGHARPTPCLGGAAVLAGFLAGALVDGVLWDGDLTPIFAGAAFLWVVGVIDDRFLLGPRIRIVAEVLAAVLLWNSGLGWSLFPGEVADLAVTVLWVVGIVNAFNLMDNLDGAAGTVVGVSAAGIALLSVYEGTDQLTALAVAVSGACAGFLYFNLTRPARIFLGDGGSMLLGFLVAALAMAVWRLNEMIGPAFLPAIMLVGVPVLDMTLVIVSRARRRAPIGRGARDHITHRLLPKLGSTWAVAAVLAIAQGALSLAAIEVMGWNRGAILAGAAVAFVLGVVTIAIFESSAFRPEPPRRSSRLGDAIPGAGRSAQASRSTGDSWGVVATSTPGRRTTSGGSPSRTERGS